MASADDSKITSDEASLFITSIILRDRPGMGISPTLAASDEYKKCAQSLIGMTKDRFALLNDNKSVFAALTNNFSTAGSLLQATLFFIALRNCEVERAAAIITNAETFNRFMPPSKSVLDLMTWLADSRNQRFMDLGTDGQVQFVQAISPGSINQLGKKLADYKPTQEIIDSIQRTIAISKTPIDMAHISPSSITWNMLHLAAEISEAVKVAAAAEPAAQSQQRA